MRNPINKNNKEDKEAILNTARDATDNQHVDETVTLGEGIKIEIKGEIGESLVREGVKLLARYLSREGAIHLVEERSVAHLDKIEMGDGYLRTDLQNFIITNKIEELQNQIAALSHTVKAITETMPPQLPPIETDTLYPAEKNLTPMRRIFDFKKITRRGFLKLGGAIGLLLAGWSMTQRISIEGLKSHLEKIELKDSNLARYARENGLSPEQIKK